MTRLRTNRFRSYVLPILLAALVFRVLVPPGFMIGGATGTLFQTSMCSGKPGQVEKFELPGESSQVHCEQCVSPLLGAPLADLRITSPLRVAASVVAPLGAQVSDTPLVRAQSARAPPHA